jgi:hypothetical protein
MEPESDEERLALRYRLHASRLKYHYRCNGDVIGDACMRCGASGDYSWAHGSDGKPAMTKEYYPFVLFKGEGR